MQKVLIFCNRYLIFILLAIIVIVGGFLRFYNISHVPVSLYWDETAAGYNSFSILKTGRDEYGRVMPLLFKSFNDYKMPGNIYLTTIFIQLFGLNEFSVRASSAFFGTLSIVVAFFIARELLLLHSQSKQKKNQRINFPIVRNYKDILFVSFLAAGLFAISPWHIQFSRTGFEANLSLFFVMTGTWLFLLFLRRNYGLSFIFSAIAYAVGLYFYRSSWVFIPLFLLANLLIWIRTVFKKENIKYGMVSLLLIFLISLPMIPRMLSKEGLLRVKQVNVFSTSQDELYALAVNNQKKEKTIWSKFIYNRRFIYARIIIGNYLSHLSPNFLFIEGDSNLRHGPIGVGNLYIWEIPFVLLGVIVCFTLQKRIFLTLLAWLLIAPIPAALSNPSPHALRSLNMLPAPQIISALGIYAVYVFFSKWKSQYLYSGILGIIVIYFFVQYLQSYYGITARVSSKDWADGYKQLTQYVFIHEEKYNKVAISGHYWEPYAYFLFYKKYNPATYQKSGASNRFANYIFGGTSWDKQKNSQEFDTVNLKNLSNGKSMLIALSPEEYGKQKDHVRVLTEIKNHNDELIFIIGEVE